MNKIDVLSKINEGMRAVLAKEDELAGNANDTSAGFEQMRLNYTAGRAYWVEGGPEMAEKVDCKVEGPHRGHPRSPVLPRQGPRKPCQRRRNPAGDRLCAWRRLRPGQPGHA